jgi:hypothetical protein
MERWLLRWFPSWLLKASPLVFCFTFVAFLFRNAHFEANTVPIPSVLVALMVVLAFYGLFLILTLLIGPPPPFMLLLTRLIWPPPPPPWFKRDH